MKHVFNFLTAYTSDNEAMALCEVERMVKECDGIEVINIEIYDESRACRNSYGEELDEDEFDEIDSDSDEAWFDDYDFTIKFTISTSLTEEEAVSRLDKNHVYVEEYDFDEER